MFESIFVYIALFFVTLLPIIFWGYIFSYLDSDYLNKKRFIFGILGGAISVIPILYMDKIIGYINFEYLNIFKYIGDIGSKGSLLSFSFSLFILLILLAGFSFIFFILFNKAKNEISLYLKNFGIFLLFTIFISFFTYFFTKYFNINFEVGGEIGYSGIVFNSFKLIFLYYLVLAFIEESSKHFNFLSTGVLNINSVKTGVLNINSVKTGVLYSIFVALGFSFIENILYFKDIFDRNGISIELVKIYFIRSIFSIMVHVLSTSIIAYYFLEAIKLYKGNKRVLPYIRLFITGIFLSVFLHLIFNVALSMGLSFIIFIYFVGGYLYVSSIFYRE